MCKSIPLLVVAFFFLSYSAIAAPPQRWVLDDPKQSAKDLEPGPGEISVDQAVTAVEELCKVVRPAKHLGVPKVRKTVLPSDVSPKYVLMFDQLYALVSCKSGKVARYIDYDAIQKASLSKIEPSGKPPTPVSMNDAEVKGYMDAMAKKLGCPDGLVLGSLREASNESNASRPSIPRIVAVYEPHPDGYRIRHPIKKFTISLNKADRALLSFELTCDESFTIESKTVVVDKKQAARLADDYLKSVRPNLPSGTIIHVRTGFHEPQLIYVSPGETKADHEPVLDRPIRLRLAWVVRYPNWQGEIWVDSSDGKILGGVFTRQ